MKTKTFLRYKILCLLFCLPVIGFSQYKYDFDKPIRSKSDEGVFEWYLEALDSTSDSLLIKMFEMSGTPTDSIHWEHLTSMVDSLTSYGQDFYSRNSFVANNRDKQINTYHFPGKSKLDRKLYLFTYMYREGVTYLTLVEYF